MNYSQAKRLLTAAEATVEYYRVLCLYFKHKSEPNKTRVLEKRLLATRLMRDALEHGHA